MAEDLTIPTREDFVTEFKRRPGNLEKEIVAFANAKGGSIYIGVDDCGKIVPFALNNRGRSQLIQSLNNCDPVPRFEINEYPDYVVLQIFEGEQKPYAAPDGFYVRIGATSQKLKRDEILRFVFRENRVQFDKQVHTIVATLTELEEELLLPVELDLYRERSKLGHNLTSEQMLRNLRLLEALADGRWAVTNGMVLLFGGQPQQVFPQARTITMLMQTPTTILDQKEFGGNLFRQYESALTYVMQHLHTAFEIKQSKRQEYLEIPEFVLRELILNGLIHRDYFEMGADFQIKLFPERIEFVNPGPLLHGLSIEEVLGSSFRRNPLLAEAFQRIGYIERAGTGLLRVKEFFDSHGLKLNIKQDAVFFDVTIERPEARKIVELYNQSNAAVPLQKEILKALKEGRLTSKELAHRLGVTDRTIRSHLKELLATGEVIKRRIGKNVHYDMQ